jgi:hypothetical protein
MNEYKAAMWITMIAMSKKYCEWIRDPVNNERAG